MNNTPEQQRFLPKPEEVVLEAEEASVFTLQDILSTNTEVTKLVSHVENLWLIWREAWQAVNGTGLRDPNTGFMVTSCGCLNCQHRLRKAEKLYLDESDWLKEVLQVDGIAQGAFFRSPSPCTLSGEVLYFFI